MHAPHEVLTAPPPSPHKRSLMHTIQNELDGGGNFKFMMYFNSQHQEVTAIRDGHHYIIKTADGIIVRSTKSFGGVWSIFIKGEYGPFSTSASTNRSDHGRVERQLPIPTSHILSVNSFSTNIYCPKRPIVRWPYDMPVYEYKGNFDHLGDEDENGVISDQLDDMIKRLDREQRQIFEGLVESGLTMGKAYRRVIKQTCTDLRMFKRVKKMSNAAYTSSGYDKIDVFRNEFENTTTTIEFIRSMMLQECADREIKNKYMNDLTELAKEERKLYKDEIHSNIKKRAQEQYDRSLRDGDLVSSVILATIGTTYEKYHADLLNHNITPRITVGATLADQYGWIYKVTGITGDYVQVRTMNRLEPEKISNNRVRYASLHDVSPASEDILSTAFNEHDDERAIRLENERKLKQALKAKQEEADRQREEEEIKRRRAKMEAEIQAQNQKVADLIIEEYPKIRLIPPVLPSPILISKILGGYEHFCDVIEQYYGRRPRVRIGYKFGFKKGLTWTVYEISRNDIYCNISDGTWDSIEYQRLWSIITAFDQRKK